MRSSASAAVLGSGEWSGAHPSVRHRLTGPRGPPANAIVTEIDSEEKLLKVGRRRRRWGKRGERARERRLGYPERSPARVGWLSTCNSPILDLASLVYCFTRTMKAMNSKTPPPRRPRGATAGPARSASSCSVSSSRDPQPLVTSLSASTTSSFSCATRRRALCHRQAARTAQSSGEFDREMWGCE